MFLNAVRPVLPRQVPHERQPIFFFHLEASFLKLDFREPAVSTKIRTAQLGVLALSTWGRELHERISPALRRILTDSVCRKIAARRTWIVLVQVLTSET